jgi:hypothetical protein
MQDRRHGRARRSAHLAWHSPPGRAGLHARATKGADVAQPLAAAFLALADDDAPTERSVPAAIAALAAALLLALSTPLAWASAVKSPDQPAATPAAKASVPAPDDDADGAA